MTLSTFFIKKSTIYQKVCKISRNFKLPFEYIQKNEKYALFYEHIFFSVVPPGKEFPCTISLTTSHTGKKIKDGR